jgi:hypothetical protein
MEDNSTSGLRSEERKMDGAKMRARLDMFILLLSACTATSVRNCIR